MPIPRSTLQATEERFRARSLKREDVLRKIEKGSLIEANDPQRIRKRMERLARTPDAPEAQPSSISKAPITTGNVGGVDPVTLERIIGRNELININYLELGLRVARSVGRIWIRSTTGRLLGYGTGVMISHSLVLTNNHVLSTPEDAAAGLLEFDFQDDINGRRRSSTLFELEPATFFITSEPLDFTLVAVKADAAPAAVSLQEFGWCPLIADEGKVILGESLNIIQHPNGEPKQLALRENLLVDILDDFIHYQTDTAPGSSGSPVFNDQWEVVGLHHSGVPRRDAQNRILTRDGTPWKPEMGEHRVDWVANEGVRVSRLVAHLAERTKEDTLSKDQRRLLDEAMEGKPAPREFWGAAAHASLAAATPPTGQTQLPSQQETDAPHSAAAAVTFTIPLQVSISLGQPAYAAPAAQQSPPLSPTVTIPPVVTQPPMPPLVPAEADAEVKQALAELEQARSKKYYNKTKDEADRDAYYSKVPEDADLGQLFDLLHELLESTHMNKPKYQPSKHVYPWVDLQPNLKLRSIYSGLEYDPEEIIREDFRIEAERTSRLKEHVLRESFSAERMAQELDLLEATLPYNCEHVVPQSWFGKREPMRGDIHHLFACESGCNSFRGNTPYFDFPEFQEAVRESCGMRVSNKFEPTAGKGAVARAVLYFLLRYPGEINRDASEYDEERLEIILRWHREHEVTDYERHRNAAIFERQGNRNPLIDFAGWADRIDFSRGLG